jgi:hypothetical protein
MMTSAVRCECGFCVASESALFRLITELNTRTGVRIQLRLYEVLCECDGRAERRWVQLEVSTDEELTRHCSRMRCRRNRDD